MAIHVHLVDQPFNPGALLGPFTNAHPGYGGLASFIGAVRADDDVRALELLHYEKMTRTGMEALAEEAAHRFELLGLLVMHRHGVMEPGEPIVMVAACAQHRRGAIAAVDYCMDHLKSDSWFWKRELRADGWHWIEPRDQDHSDLARWSK